MIFDDEMDRRMARARLDLAATVDAEERRRREKAARAAERDRLWLELVDASSECAERLRDAQAATRPLVRDGHRWDGEQGWFWYMGGFQTLYELVSIRSDGVFGLAKEPPRNGTIRGVESPYFVWDEWSQDPPGICDEHFTVRDGAIVMKVYDMRDGYEYAPVLEAVLRGTARLLVAQE